MAPAMLRSLTAAAGLLASLSYARPLARRAVVWETVTDVVVETVDVTTTVTCVPGPPATYGPSLHETPTPTPSSSSSSSSSAPSYTPPAEFAPKPTPSTPPAEPPAYTPPPPAYTSPPPPPPPEYTPEPSPEPTPTPAPEPAPEPEPTPSPPSGGGSECSYGSACTGEMTFYGGGLGACGNTIDTTTDDAIALPHQFMGQESNSNDYCGKTVTIEYGGVTSTAKIMDKCMGCEGYSIDMTKHLFNKFASLGEGRISGVQWWFN